MGYVDELTDDEIGELTISDSESSDPEFLDASNESMLPSELGRLLSNTGLSRSDREQRIPGPYSDFVAYSSFLAKLFPLSPYRCLPTRQSMTLEATRAPQTAGSRTVDRDHT